jgi:hypothetical protein
MIGVLAPGSDCRVISEFFELFKTPWEYLESNRIYDVILCIGDVDFDRNAAKLVLHYADCRLPLDAEEQLDIIEHNGSELLSRGGDSLVIYGTHVTFCDCAGVGSGQSKVLEPWLYRCKRNAVSVTRIGYDLFAQIAHLLAVGQPEEFAQFPTLELHISLLRGLIVECGIELLEIPPVPEGFGCVACMTHDIDHPAIRNHKWDATAFGFLYRATAGSFVNFIRGRVSFRELVKNCAAALKLPFVYMGMAKDFWSGFEDRYREFENGIRSTYFVISFGNQPGTDFNGPAPQRRASRYSAADIKDSLLKIRANGDEVALHGIDAWHNSESGRRELNEVRELTGDTELGIRMHWLFYSEESPRILEQAGAAYDSTLGYRTTVGFRSGTTQVYKPIEAALLLELPLHIMDTALFYTAYLGLSQGEAESQVHDLITAVARLGGCLTVNWHDRSLASERNWGSCYRALIEELKLCNAWFATAGEAVAWFRMRRSVVFEKDMSNSGTVRSRITDFTSKSLPGLRLRRHKLDRGAKTGALTVSHFDTQLEVAVDGFAATNSRD